MSNIYYNKERKISFPAIKIKLSDIPILKSEKLTIYQKYAVLLLNEGINSSNRDELIEKISIALNIKNSFIREFIEILTELNYIVNENGVYHLSEEYKIIVDETDSTIMRANIGIEKADFDNLFYIPELHRICDYSFFDDNKIPVAKSNNESKVDKSEINNSLVDNKNLVEEIIRKNLIKDGFKPCKDIIYNLSDTTDYSFSINATYLYEYNGEISQLQEIKYDENLEIPLELINEKSRDYLQDDKLPKFIEYSEKFYEKYNTNETTIDNLSDQEKIKNETIAKLEETIKDINEKAQSVSKEKKSLEKTLDSNSSEIKKLNSMIEELKNEISEKNNELSQTRVELNNMQHEKNLIKEEQKKLLSKMMDPVIDAVVGKFSKYSKLNSKVNIICSHIDKAVSANEYDSFDDLFESISQARGLYNKTFKAIFDITFDKVEEKLAAYYDPMRYQTKIEEMMKKNTFGIDISTFQKIKIMHSVFNDDYHELDISLNRKFTKEDFKNLDKKDRYTIITSIIVFLKNLNLSDNQLKNIDAKLSEN